MRVLSIVHQADAAAGTFAEEVAARGHELEEWLIPEEPMPPSPLGDYEAVLVFGGAVHVDQEDRHGWLRDERLLLQRLAADGLPLLGVCLGGQLVAKALHAHVWRLPSPEIGWPEVELTDEAANDPLFAGLPTRFPSFQWHLYHFELPAGAVALARNERCLQAFRAGESTWAIQFHAEVTGRSVRDWLASSAPEEDGPLDAEALRAETDQKIGAWNALGRALCGRFLDYAASARPRGATTRATSPRS
jgi:GMP synthase (glutamine-hydrolysing)